MRENDNCNDLGALVTWRDRLDIDVALERIDRIRRTLHLVWDMYAVGDGVYFVALCPNVCGRGILKAWCRALDAGFDADLHHLLVNKTTLHLQHPNKSNQTNTC